MNLIAIIVLTVILVLTFFLITFLLMLLQKHRRAVLNNFAKDLNNKYQHVQLQKLNKKNLPVNVEQIKEDIYFCNKAVIGKYENLQKVINEKNWSVSEGLENNKIKIFYHYKLINLKPSKFIPLNKIDLLLTKDKLYLYHPFEPEILELKAIKNITVFWEKNSLVQSKKIFPGLAFIYQKQNYFLLFQSYNEILKFLSYLNLIN